MAISHRKGESSQWTRDFEEVKQPRPYSHSHAATAMFSRLPLVQTGNANRVPEIESTNLEQLDARTQQSLLLYLPFTAVLGLEKGEDTKQKIAIKYLTLVGYIRLQHTQAQALTNKGCFDIVSDNIG